MLYRVSSLCVLWAVAGSASADLVNPLVPSWAGEPTASSYEWNAFSEAYNAPNFPDSPFSTDAMLFNFTEGAFITGAGNIYNMDGGLNVHVYGSGPVGLAVLNVATSGSELNYDQTMLVLRDEFGEEEAFFADAQIRFEEEVPGLGKNVTVAYEFDATSSMLEAVEWAFLFNGTEPHLSLDAVSADINSVPGPASLLALGLFSVIRRRRG